MVMLTGGTALRAFGLLLLACHTPASLSQNLVGTLSNFDVSNDTNETCHGFEIEIDGVDCSQITYTFGAPWSRYGDPSRETKLDSSSNPVGCYVRYRSQYNNVTNSWVQSTIFSPQVNSQVQSTGGHACYNGGPIGAQYDTSGCEHFGLGLNYLANPTSTTYRWIIADPTSPGQLKVFGTNVKIPAVSWNGYVAPNPNPNPAQPAAQVNVVQAQIEEEPNPECSKYGAEARWVRAFQRESPDHLQLEELVSDNPKVPKGEDVAEIEIEWQLMQALPTCDENGGPLAANNSLVLEKELGADSNALTKRYEFFKYTGAYDPETNEALPISDSPPNATDLGAYIGSQMVAANLVLPLVVVSGSLSQGEVGLQYSQPVVTGGFAPYEISVTGSLPEGLIIDTATGELSGIPTIATDQTLFFSVTATDANGTSTTGDMSLDILPSFSIVTQDLPLGEIGVDYSVNIAVTGGFPPLAWILNDTLGVLPSGLTLDYYTGTLNMTASNDDDTPINPAGATYSLNIVVVDALQRTREATIPWTLVGPPVITTISLSVGEKGAAYSKNLDAVNGIPPFTWSVSGLPSGLSLNSLTGLLSGIPSTFGSFSLSVTVTDSNLIAGTKTLVLNVVNSVSISTSSLPKGTIGSTYSAQLAASGGVPPMAWAASSSLPSGLLLNTSTGLIAGTPAAAGSFGLNFSVKDALLQTFQKNLVLKVITPLTIVTSTFPNGATGVSYSTTLAASGGTAPYTWSITGTLPSGIMLNSATGILSGTPTQSGSFTSLKVKVTDADSLSSSQTMQLTIENPVTITTSSLPTSTVGVTYSTMVAASGGATPYIWSVTGLPTGLALNSTGFITGTPSVNGTFTVIIDIKDANSQKSQKSLALKVILPLNINVVPLPKGAIGLAYSTTLTASGGIPPVVWSTTSTFPPGLSLNSTTGTVSGTPSVSGSFTMTFHARDGLDRNQDKDFIITIVAPVNISTSSLAIGQTGVSYSAGLTATGGALPLTWSVIGALPTGLSFNAATAVLSGIPTTSGSFPLSFTAKDTLLQTTVKALTLTVVASPTKAPVKPVAPVKPTVPRKPAAPVKPVKPAPSKPK